MPLLVSCPKCNQKLKVVDAAAGKKIKCPACLAVFIDNTSKSAKPLAIEPVAIEPVALDEETPESEIAAAESTSPPRQTVKKKKSKALLYGCLGAGFVVLLIVGLIVGGIVWLVPKTTNAVEKMAHAPFVPMTPNGTPFAAAAGASATRSAASVSAHNSCNEFECLLCW